MTPTHAIILTHRAFDEVEAIIDILRRYSPEVAQHWYAHFRQQMKTLEWLPERFPFAPEDRWAKVGLRQRVFGKRRSACRILYRIKGNTVRLLSVRYGQRSLIRKGDLELE